MGEEPNVTDAAFPLSLTDVITAVERILGILERAVGYVGATGNAVQRYKGRRVSDALDVLAFRSGGSQQHLEAIAAGKGTLADFEAIATRMNRTGEEVEEALDFIAESRKFIRRRYGMPLANRLDKLMYAGGGKASIRIDLYRLARMEDPFFSADDVAAEARKILENIHALNRGLEEAHDLLIELKKQENE